MQYVAEQFTPEESDALRPYFTSIDGPVFALVNLPEVVKGALFARYSRSDKSLRRLFLDEFAGDLDLAGDLSYDASVGVSRAEQLYEKVFLEYGDDSVAQLGGVHLACEQASNILTKILEWGRLMAYLEQSTRYIPYDSRLGGRFRYLRAPEVLESPLGALYIAEMDRLFTTYQSLLPRMMEWARERYPKDADDSDFVYKQTIKAKACDAVRGILPAATLSNVGIYGTGQAYEALLLRMRAHPLPEARSYADLMLTELRKVIPSFLTRVDRPDRGGAWSRYLEETREQTSSVVQRVLGGAEPEARPGVTLVDFDPEGEDKVLAAICYPHADLPEDEIVDRVRRLGAEDRRQLLAAYVGERSNRRHKPGRALERTDYRFDVLADYGAFRDHRVAAAVTPARVRPARGRGRGRGGAGVRRGHGSVGGTARGDGAALPRAGLLRGRARVPHPVHDAVQRSRGVPHARAAQRAPGPPRLPNGGPGDAPTHRRAGGTPRTRSRHALRGSRRLRARAARGRTGRGSPPGRSRLTSDRPRGARVRRAHARPASPQRTLRAVRAEGC
jgi:thymidylate synthase ThyX